MGNTSLFTYGHAARGSILLQAESGVIALCKMCARTTAEYQEELWGPKEEKKPQRQLLDAVFNLRPQNVLLRPDISENLHPDWQQSVSCHIKEEGEDEEVQRIKEEEEEVVHMKEEEQEEIIQVPVTGVQLKSEDEGQTEERRGAEPPSRNSSSDGDLCERSQTDRHDDDEQSEDVSEYLHPERQESGHIKEEVEEVQGIKEKEKEIIHMKEEEQEEIIQVPATGVHLKSEDEGQSEERRGAEPPESESGLLAKCVKTHREFFSGSQCSPGMTFRTTRNNSSDGDHCGGSQTDDDDDDNDDEQSERDMTCHTTNKCWKCSWCGKTFASIRNFKQHVKIHTGTVLPVD
ncbi:cilia- and flagella-associated protein 251-like isoform X5 [Syngnathoides biaculeatus]|uniref:cilia- and flagella-associated protein 251-like isoform X5 n=1 Tax=Syngnathoides biaculeatus TaxID=300417 RepID=UPI002ADE4E68|nr:cilia- and flagella-associated protein 251-like isoform X5 [Syngnathoides biaculeatus]